nr:hypothetical protein [Tanacetum cinerariifolium]
WIRLSVKKRKTSKDAEPSKGSKSKESKSSSSKGTKSQPKSSGKSTQAEESVFETKGIEMIQNQGSDLGNTDDQPIVKDALERDCNPQGIIYVDKFKRNKLMRLDELYKFSDRTLTSVRCVLHDITSNLRMDYLPKRRWSKLEKQRSHIMIKEIDKLQLERRLMRNLEKFVCGREYIEDFRLIERII